MWEQITPADLERAKAAWAAMREKILARHQEEIKILEMDGNLLRNLETGLMAFHQRFMSPPQLTAVSTETPLHSIDAPVADKSAASVDEKATVVTLPTSSGPDEPGSAEGHSPNFAERARKWVGAE